MKPKLFILQMPFRTEDGELWFCSHCAMIEGALLVNPHWDEAIEVNRLSSTKPRQALVELLGEEKQWMPVLITGPSDTITDPVQITKYLADRFGGAAPHP